MVGGAAFQRRELLHLAVQDRIKRFIIAGGFQPGDLLPPEAELARALGVSRPSLREAMKALQSVGLVETRQGAGTFVGRFSLDHLVAGLAFTIRSDLGRNLRTLRDLVEIREILERDLVARVAPLMTPPLLERLTSLVAGMEARAERGELFPAEDRAFHEALYRPLGNALLTQLLGAFWEVFAAVRDELPGEGPLSRETAAGHRRIVEALAAGDGPAAAAAMTAHFAGIHQRLRAAEEALAALATAPD